jgi:hypothetical protein
MHFLKKNGVKTETSLNEKPRILFYLTVQKFHE